MAAQKQELNVVIDPKFYNDYFDALLSGDRQACTQMVKTLLDQRIHIKTLYRELFEKSLYQIGDLWERNKISVAKEHLVTAITESLLNQVYPHLFQKKPTGRKVVISCAANEHHQIGGKMVADIFGMNGWDSYFLGANTPIDQMTQFIHETKPDLVGLSLSIYFNMPSLKKGIDAISSQFPNLEIVIGGQAFRWGELPSLKEYKNVTYLSSLDELEGQLKD